MQNQLQKALDLVRKTGDKLVVFDSESNKAFAIVSLDEYEKLTLSTDSTEMHAVNDINVDISAQGNDIPFLDHNIFEEKSRDSLKDNYDEFDNDDYGGYDDFDDEKKESWGIPNGIKEGAEEVIEEDRQYLEDLPF